MSKEIYDGGPAFPETRWDEITRQEVQWCGMSLRDWFAGTMQEDDRLVKVVRAMDDKALEWFALYPTVEMDEAIAQFDFTDWNTFAKDIDKITRRLELEAKAIARVRYMQADAMLKAREQ